MNVREDLAQPETPPRISGGGSRPVWEIILGFALLTPAAIFLVISYVEPAAWTVATSLEPFDMPQGWTGVSEGSSTFSAIMTKGFGSAVGFSLKLLKMPLMAVVLVAPILAWCVRRLRRWGRAVIVAGLAPLALAFTPTAIAATVRVARHADLIGSDERAVGGVDGVTRFVVNIFGCASFALIVLFAMVLYLAAYRGRQRSALAIAAGVAVAAVMAVALQEFTYPFVLTGGGPDLATTTPVLFMFSVGFQQLSFGPAAAASTLLMGMLAALGIAVTFLVVVTGARLDLDDHRPEAPRWGRSDIRRTGLQGVELAGLDLIPIGPDGDPVSPPVRPIRRRVVTSALGVTAVVIVVALYAVTLYAIHPWVVALVENADPAPGSVSTMMIFANTWVPSLISAVVGASVAAVGGYGIGAARPLGRRSEWLLLLRSFPLCGCGATGLTGIRRGATADRFQTIFGLIPPSRLTIPALFVFTLLARGQAIKSQIARRDGVSRSWFQTHVLPTLPMAGVLILVTWVAQAQDLLWPVLSGSGDLATGPVRLYDILGGGGLAGSVPVSLALPWWIVMILGSSPSWCR